MPFISESLSSGSSDVESNMNPAFDTQHIISDAKYAAASFLNYSEKPLSEQLEPIAVVGMGKTSSSPWLYHVQRLTIYEKVAASLVTSSRLPTSGT